MPSSSNNHSGPISINRECTKPHKQHTQLLWVRANVVAHAPQSAHVTTWRSKRDIKPDIQIFSGTVFNNTSPFLNTPVSFTTSSCHLYNRQVCFLIFSLISRKDEHIKKHTLQFLRTCWEDIFWSCNVHPSRSTTAVRRVIFKRRLYSRWWYDVLLLVFIYILIFITTLFIFLIVVMFVRCIVALIRQTVRSMRSGWTVNFWQFSDGTSMLRIELRLVNSTTSLTLDHVSASLCTNFASEKLPERKILQFEYFSVVCIYCATVQFRISYNKFFNSFPILTNCKIYKILFTLYTKDPKISYNDIYIENRS